MLAALALSGILAAVVSRYTVLLSLDVHVHVYKDGDCEIAFIISAQMYKTVAAFSVQYSIIIL